MKNKLISPVGFGELLHVLFYPFAVILGRVRCKSCECRREAFNRILPDVNPMSVGWELLQAFRDCSCDCDDKD